jgi:signal transduction histidine kinase/pSer/pThr/pTyr-binding forkhead associated (FHA) protein
VKKWNAPFSVPGWIVPRLIVIKGADEGKQFELTSSVVGAGRDGTNQIRLHDTEVSRRHAEFRQIEGGYSLADVGSANGTFVNNLPVTEVVLQAGDHVQIGQSVLVYSAGRSEMESEADLADRISLITRQDIELASAIVKTVGETEGSRILARPDQAGTPWLQTALANLGIMYEAIHSISHILDLDQLLEKIMDLIFKSIDADRGCIMLRNDVSGEFEPKAVRWRQGAGGTEKMGVSRTIMDHVLADKQGVLVSDAARDERFSSGQSVVRLGIREVICVPMKGRHETLGVLYLDTTLVSREALLDVPLPMKFSEDHLKLAIAIAHQAALAVEDTRYRQAMLQAERLAAIGQAMAALSHHIKNILQGLRSGSEILRMGLSDKNDGLLQQGWKIVEKNQGKIYDLVMDMLSYSKEREPVIEDTDINRIVQDVLELLQGRFNEVGARLETRLGDQLPIVAADPEGIHRAVLNIVANALDALGECKNPTIAVATSIERDGKWARIVVHDNGPGIPANRVTDIFRPFVSTKGSKGTGLGLAVSRKILREHGGDILVQSRAGKGCKFILRLPLRSPLTNELGGTGSEVPTLRPPDE